MTQKQINDIQTRQDEARLYAGVEALAFHRFWGGSEYHAVGAYRVDGQVVIRWDSDEFSVRVPATARALYFSTMYRGQDDAAGVLRRYTGLPAELDSLVRQAAMRTTLPA